MACALALSACSGPSSESPAASKDATAPGPAAAATTGAPSLDEVRAIAREAYIYGFPLIDNYRIQHAYFVDTKNPEYKGPWNQLTNIARVFTPDDVAIQTPNSDTPYSSLGLDLRAEPVVLTVPAIDKDRYFSVQLIDAYTHNFAYIGSRTTGNGGGTFLIAGPSWKGEAPKGITQVLTAETELVFALYRTQLKGPADLPAVTRVQAGYKVQTLSQFLGTPAPAAAPPFPFVAPLTGEQQKTSADVFRILNTALVACPTHPSEVALMERFAKIGVGAGKPFDVASLSPEVRKALEDGIADAWKEFGAFKAASIDTGKVTSGDVFGTRDFLKNNYLYRMTAAVLGIYGNSRDEAMYPTYFVDAKGQPLDGSTQNYRLRFAPGQLPPVNAFWSLTLYTSPQSLLYANPLKRYLINSPMLPSLKKDADGGLTLYVQHDSPGKALESNWLPAPNGPMRLFLRLYWPKSEAVEGTWKAPQIEGTPK